jgi:flavin-dependent dehydrogenase
MDRFWGPEPAGSRTPAAESDDRRLGDGKRARMIEADVAILGGGPAGAATALALARSGYRVVLLERTAYESARIGETLPPEVRSPLVALGLWARFLVLGPVASPGIVSAWGDCRPYASDFLLNPHGCGWNVDRVGFDAMLARGVEEAGGIVLRSARLIGFEGLGPRGWRLEAEMRGKATPIRAEIVVDATGRSGTLAGRLGARRVVYDRLIGLVATFSARRGAILEDRRTLVEAGESGWWYTAALPGGRLAAAYMTDADLLPRGRGILGRPWRDRLDQAPLTASRLGDRRALRGPRAVIASSTRLDRCAGVGWLATGDASAAFDPLSAQGIYKALTGGIDAARAIDGRFRGDRRSLEHFAERTAADYGRYLQVRSAYYDQERRWPDSEFWRRRHARR